VTRWWRPGRPDPAPKRLGWILAVVIAVLVTLVFVGAVLVVGEMGT
jgi:hypothetical protein